MTPAVIASPAASASLPDSTEWTEPLLECRDEFDPAPLPNVLGLSNPPLPSYRLSVGFSLCIFLPKNDLPPEDCLDALSACVVVGMVVRSRFEVGRHGNIATVSLAWILSQCANHQSCDSLMGDCRRVGQEYLASLRHPDTPFFMRRSNLEQSSVLRGVCSCL